MAIPASTQTYGERDWRSDASVAYAIFRLTFGINIAVRGFMRIANGTDNFANGLAGQFENTILPAFSIQLFGNVVPWVESVLGIMIILGLGTRIALILGGLMMTSLTFGTMLLQNFELAWLQLNYTFAFFALLAFRAWNLISLDAMRGNVPSAAATDTRASARV